MKLIAYLWGGMEHAANYGADWRTEIEAWFPDKLGHGAFNPVRESEVFLKSRHPGVDFRSTKSGDIELHRRIAKEIVRFDCREIILRSDYLICYYDESAQQGGGTKGELTVAAAFGKPVYLVTGMKVENIPSWIIGCADEIFKDFGTLKNFLLKKFSV
ncbi:MAG TPA: hypothetical protein VLX91_09005 [Candidatus Acidoferrales bacterium]|nr:hypothetical protein [Candidatus Acidoferrales bacterium]